MATWALLFYALGGGAQTKTQTWAKLIVTREMNGVPDNNEG